MPTLPGSCTKAAAHGPARGIARRDARDAADRRCTAHAVRRARAGRAGAHAAAVAATAPQPLESCLEARAGRVERDEIGARAILSVGTRLRAASAPGVVPVTGTRMSSRRRSDGAGDVLESGPERGATKSEVSRLKFFRAQVGLRRSSRGAAAAAAARHLGGRERARYHLRRPATPCDRRAARQGSVWARGTPKIAVLQA